MAVISDRNEQLKNTVRISAISWKKIRKTSEISEDAHQQDDEVDEFIRHVHEREVLRSRGWYQGTFDALVGEHVVNLARMVEAETQQPFRRLSPRAFQPDRACSDGLLGSLLPMQATLTTCTGYRVNHFRTRAGVVACALVEVPVYILCES